MALPQQRQKIKAIRVARRDMVLTAVADIIHFLTAVAVAVVLVQLVKQLPITEAETAAMD